MRNYTLLLLGTLCSQSLHHLGSLGNHVHEEHWQTGQVGQHGKDEAPLGIDRVAQLGNSQRAVHQCQLASNSSWVQHPE